MRQRDVFLKRSYVFIFRKRKRGRKRGRETSMCDWYVYRLPLARPQLGAWLTTQARARAGNKSGNLPIRKPMLNPLSHTSQGPRGCFHGGKNRDTCWKGPWLLWNQKSTGNFLGLAGKAVVSSTLPEIILGRGSPVSTVWCTHSHLSAICLTHWWVWPYLSINYSIIY